MKIYCRSCERVTKHRQKGLRNPVNVCNKCDITNMPVRLIKSNGETHLAKQVQFIEWSGEELGSRGKKLHDGDIVFMLTKFNKDKNTDMTIPITDYDRIVTLHIKKGRELDYHVPNNAINYRRETPRPTFEELRKVDDKSTPDWLKRKDVS